MKNRLSLPTELTENQNHLIIFDCTKLFGEEFGKYCDEKLREIDGKDWFQNLINLRKQFKINLYDPAFLLKECLTSDSPLRKILPKSKSFYDKLSILKRVRNESQHFSFQHTSIKTKEIIELFFDITLEINLPICTQEYSSLLRRINDLESGIEYKPDLDVSLRIEEIEKQKSEIEDELIEKNAILRDKEIELTNVQEMIAIQNSQISELTQLKNLEHSASDLLKEELERSENEAENLRQQLSDLQAQKESDEAAGKEFDKLITALTRTISTDYHDSPSIKVFTKSYLNSESEVGASWNKPKGKRKITLSIGKRDLIDSKTNKPLEDISEATRKTLAENWLRIRPSGGRVFVDEEGNATTLLGESLIYLGNISDLEA